MLLIILLFDEYLFIHNAGKSRYHVNAPLYNYFEHNVPISPFYRCQTYEGGFGGVPGMEAHGGYSFCGLAALMFLRKGRLCNIDTLLKWAANRQMRVEGGFQVRFLF